MARRALPVYARQHFPEALRGETLPDFRTAGTTLFEDDAIRLWTLDDAIVIASIKTKMHAISTEVTARPGDGAWSWPRRATRAW